MTVSDQVGTASNLVGLLLILVTLFTSEQARSLDAERTRVGGARSKPLLRISLISIALAAVTVTSFLTLIPLVRKVIDARGTHLWQPIFLVFLLVWVLLLFLCSWQFAVAVGAWRSRP
jgi:hypothetical protein